MCVCVLPEGRINTSIIFACYSLCPLLPGRGIPWQWQLESSHSKHSSEFQQEEAFSSSSSTLTVSDVQQGFPILYAEEETSTQFPNSKPRQISIHFWHYDRLLVFCFSVFSPFASRICSSVWLGQQRWAAQKFYWKSLMNDKLASASTRSIQLLLQSHPSVAWINMRNDAALKSLPKSHFNSQTFQQIEWVRQLGLALVSLAIDSFQSPALIGYAWKKDKNKSWS